MGLRELVFENNLLLWPNPSDGKIKIAYTSNEIPELSVYKTEGKRVFVKEAVRSNDEINLSGLSKGIYLVG